MIGYSNLLATGRIAHKGGGGGGSSGAVSWPSYIQNFHEDMLVDGLTSTTNISVNTALREAWDQSPFSSAYSYDPTTDLADTETSFDSYETILQAIDTDADWSATVDTVVAKVDGSIVDDSDIQARVEAFDERQTSQIMNSIGRLSMSMVAANAVMTTGYVMGMASLEHEAYRERNRVHRELTMEAMRLRHQHILEGIRFVYQGIFQNTELNRAYVLAKAEVNRVKIAAQTDYLHKDLDIAFRDTKWNLDIWQHGANMVAGIQGGVEIPDQGSSTKSIVGGAIGGLASGAAIGTMIAPGIGTAIGAGVGAVAGGAAGAL